MRSLPASAQRSLKPSTTDVSAAKGEPKRKHASSSTDKNPYLSPHTYLSPHNEPTFLFPFVQPEQFFAEPHYSLRRTGEYRLLIAVLQDALECWFRYQGAQRVREQRLLREIEEWFSSHNHDRLFAFECICDYLALDPDSIRRGLMQCRLSHA